MDKMVTKKKELMERFASKNPSLKLKPGEWICYCGEKVKFSRGTCKFCKSTKESVIKDHEKPHVEYTPTEPSILPKPKEIEIVEIQGNEIKTEPIAVSKNVFDDLKDGDWICSCGQPNDAESTECHSCHMQLPEDVDEIEVMEESIVQEDAENDPQNEVKRDFFGLAEEEDEEIKKELIKEMVEQTSTTLKPMRIIEKLASELKEGEKWLCDCGGKNSRVRTSCVFCAEQRQKFVKIEPSIEYWQKQPKLKEPETINPKASWTCSECHEKNKWNIMDCFKCFKPKEAVEIQGGLVEDLAYRGIVFDLPNWKKAIARMPKYKRSVSPTTIDAVKNLLGYWTCECGEKNLKRLRACEKCTKPKPDDPLPVLVPATSVSVSTQLAKFDVNGTSLSKSSNKPEKFVVLDTSRKTKKSSNSSSKSIKPLKPGEWYCPSCGEKVKFGRNHCFFCQTQRPLDVNTELEEVQIKSGVAPHLEPKPIGLGEYAVIFNNIKPGDWICKCGEKVKAKRERCWLCRRPKTNDVHIPIPDIPTDVPTKPPNAKKAKFGPPRPSSPEESVTISHPELDIRSKMADPCEEILYCEYCSVPVGDEKMLDHHYTTKTHRIKMLAMMTEKEMKYPRFGGSNVNHKYYFFAHGHGTKPEYGSAMNFTNIDEYYIDNLASMPSASRYFYT